MSEHEHLEFLISQYLDGTLSSSERNALEARLAQDPKLQELLEEYSRLDDVVRTALPAPEFDWEDFSDRISSAVAMMPHPAPSYRLPWVFAGAAALAACALLAVGITLHQRRQSLPAETAVNQPEQPVVQLASAVVVGPKSESPAGDSWAEVGLGPPPAEAAMLVDDSGPIVAQPSHVFIASALATNDPSTH